MEQCARHFGGNIKINNITHTPKSVQDIVDVHLIFEYQPRNFKFKSK